MKASTPDSGSDLRSLNQARFHAAKKYWLYAISTKCVGFIFGGVTLFWLNSWSYSYWMMLGIMLTAEVLQLASDYVKAQSEKLLRKLDMCLSFNIELSPADARDIAAASPRSERKKSKKEGVLDTYFTSRSSVGPVRAIENLLESAWYTERQCQWIIYALYIIIGVFVALSFIALIIISNEGGDASTRHDVSRVLTSWLLLLFSLGLIRNLVGYQNFRNQCLQTIRTAEFMQSNSVLDIEAIKQWHEYQIGRSNSPLLPNWVWNLMKDNLSEDWSRYCESRDRATSNTVL